MTYSYTAPPLCSCRHPSYWNDSLQWEEYRLTFQGGIEYLRAYLRKFSNRETDSEFAIRLSLTPIPSFAKSAILDVRNSIFQRLTDVIRIGGSKNYDNAVAGNNCGIDGRGSSMNSFIGIDVLTELLVMGRVGVFVDAPSQQVYTLAQTSPTPYCYFYPVEDILSWSYLKQGESGTFKSVLLRDNVVDCEPEFDLPTGQSVRYRLIWIGQDGYVRYKFLDADSNLIYQEDMDETGSIKLNLTEIPFIMPDINGSLLKDAASYQKALLNLISTDVNYALQSNAPFLTIQEDFRSVGSHLKEPESTGPEPGGQRAQDDSIHVGATRGRIYQIGTDRPAFISPSEGPLMASIKLQERLEDNIRELINLAVTNSTGSRTESAEAKKLGSQGLEAGLSYFALILQKTEAQIAKYWSTYENRDPAKRQTAVIAYPDRFILKSDSERVADAKDLNDLTQDLPGNTVKKEAAKSIAHILFGGKIAVDKLDKIYGEIESAKYSTSNPETIMSAKEAGLVGSETACEAMGFDKSEVEIAKAEHAERLAEIAKAQTPVGNMAARGVPDAAVDTNGGVTERAATTNTDTKGNTQAPVRGGEQ